MDPCLEAHWRDVHASLIIYARDALQGELPGALRARVEERVLLETPNGLADHPLDPEVRVVEYGRKRGAKGNGKSSVAVAEPMLVQLESVSETFIEVIDRESGKRVVTVIEFLSPTSKLPGPNGEQCYRNGGYEGTLNYAAAPDPPLAAADQTWSADRLREAGLRPRRKPRRKGKPRS